MGTSARPVSSFARWKEEQQVVCSSSSSLRLSLVGLQLGAFGWPIIASAPADSLRPAAPEIGPPLSGRIGAGGQLINLDWLDGQARTKTHERAAETERSYVFCLPAFKRLISCAGTCLSSRRSLSLS